jgi:methionyl-tRNA synthetase
MGYYVTTSIPYANAKPHIGFAMELVQGDALARYARQQGKQVLYSTGTDEHGTKVAIKAEELGREPIELADELSADFRALTKKLNVSNDRFIRTTDEAHERRAQVVWRSLSKQIYKGKYIGWYCIGCEEYVTDSIAKERGGVCPNHQKPYEKLSEENYFFRLSDYSQAIEQAIVSGQFQIVPEQRKNEILHVIRSGLEDISVSRPVDKLSWGVPVPGDKTQVMYVWFEALMNYITVLGYPEHQDFKTFWPADVQVVGKDILRFHAAIWPAMLLALELPLPKQLYVHGFITVENQKMSKSLGNVIDPSELVDRYGVDAARYYLLRHIPAHGDGDFSWDKLHTAYTNELANELGNTVQRTAVMLNKYQNGVIGDVELPGHDTAKYHEAMSVSQFDRALEEVWHQVRGLNQYIDEQKPWEVAKTDDKEHLGEILSYQVGCLLQIADLLVPFLPETAARITALFGDGIVKMQDTTLFPRVETTDQ